MRIPVIKGTMTSRPARQLRSRPDTNERSKMICKQTLLAAPVVGVLVLVFSACALVLAQGVQPIPFVFANVNVIPSDHEGVQQGRTVLVRGDRIAAVGSRSEIKVPPDAVAMDCTGRCLVQGLMDSHVHLPVSPVVRTRDDFDDAPI